MTKRICPGALSMPLPRHPILPTLHPGQFLMGAKLCIGTPRCKTKLSSKMNWFGLCKMHGFRGNHYMILKNGGRPTQSIVSRGQFILEH